MGLADRVIGIKAKKVLMESIFLFANKYSKVVNNWSDQVSELMYSAVRENFDFEMSKAEDHTTKFLQWLGFTPVDVKWQPDLKVGRFMIGTSRMWTKDPKTDPVTKVLLRSVISAIGEKFLGEKPEVVEIQGQLPPRIIVGYEIRERYGNITASESVSEPKISKPPAGVKSASTAQTPSIQTEKQSEQSLGAMLNPQRYIPSVVPFVGPAIKPLDAAQILMEETHEMLKRDFAKDLEAFEASSLNLLLFLFQRSAKKEIWKQTASELGKNFAKKMHEKHKNIKANDAIEGLGSLDPSTFEELLFYGKHQSTEEFCFFLALIWQEYIAEFIGIEFKADQPLCSSGGSSPCLYAFVK